MINKLLTFFESIAMRLEKFLGWITIASALGVVVFIYGLKSMSTLIGISIMWLWGITLLGHMYKPKMIKDNNGQWVYVGKMRLESPAIQIYSVVFMVLWLAFLMTATFMSIIPC